MNKVSLVIGRFQPLHDGHISLINKLIDEEKQVCVALMDTEIDSHNPYTIEQRKKMFQDAYGDKVQVITIPPIAEVCYGRNVGYDVRRVRHEREDVSASKLRAEDPIGSFEDEEFVRLFKKMAEKVHQLMVSQGFWQDGEKRNICNPIALGHSEFSEALECFRLGNPPDKNITDMNGGEVQLADVLGILMDMQIGYGLDIARALTKKMEFNKSRGWLHVCKKF